MAVSGPVESMSEERTQAGAVIDRKAEKKLRKKEERKEDKKKKRQKRNALIVCHDRSEFWTTQKQFWQWAREGVIIKTGDNPLAGKFVREDEEKTVVLANTVLNLACPNHLREALTQRRFAGKR
jgi:hypothetical protein